LTITDLPPTFLIFHKRSLDLTFVNQLVVFLFADFTGKGIIEARIYSHADALKHVIVDIAYPAAHSASDFMFISLGLEHGRSGQTGQLLRLKL
jgi:hypothetical protein